MREWNVTLIVTTAAQICLSWGNSRSEQGVLPRIKIFCGKIDFHGISFQENEMKCFLWWQSLSLHLSRWLLGSPGSPCSVLEGCWMSGIFGWAKLGRIEDSRWVKVGGSCSSGWNGAESSVHSAMPCLERREISLTFPFFFFFLNIFFQEKALGFCHLVWLWNKTDLKCWGLPQDEGPCFLVISTCKKHA